MSKSKQEILGGRSRSQQNSYSQLRLFFILITGIFLAEVVASIIIYFWKPESFCMQTLLDALIMCLLIFPILYFLHFRQIETQITERTRSETLLEKVLENLPVGVWIVDQSGSIIHGNQASQKIWGGARYVDATGYGEYKAWRLDNGKPVEPGEWAAVRSIQHGETLLEEELEIECFDGSHKFILNSATPIFENSTIQGAIVVNQDISQRVKYETELIQSNELIQSAFNSIDILIAYMDRDFNFIQVNEAFARHNNQTADYFSGKNYFNLFPTSENREIFQNVLYTKAPYSAMEKPVVEPQYPERGVTYWNWRLQPVLASNNNVQGLVLSSLNITERKRAEMQLEQQNQELHELSLAESKQRLLAEGLVQSMLALNASLELNEVLNSILEQIHYAIPYDLGNIVLIDEGNLRIVHQHNLIENLDELENNIKPYLLADFPELEILYSTQQPVLIEDIPCNSDQPMIPGIGCLRSYLGVPLVIGEHVTGIINLTSNRPGNFNREVTRRLMAFATPAALAVENARLFAAELQARHIAETLNAISLALSQTLDIGMVMNTLLEHICGLVASDCAYIVMIKNETDLAIQTMCGYEDESNPIFSRGNPFDAYERPYLQEVIHSKKSLLIPDTQQYPGWEPLISRGSIRSWLGVPILVGNESMGVLALAKHSPNFFTGEHIQLSEIIVAQASVAIQNANLYEQVHSGHERLQSLSRRMVEVQENERRYIARELHDVASQSLTAIMFGLRLLEQDVQGPEINLARLTELKNLTDGVLEELHRLAIGLRPASLDYLGLEVSLEQLVKGTGDHYNINTHFKTTGSKSDQRLPEHVETSVYRIVQEALTNVVRHANAKNIDVILEYLDGKTILIVEDDGVGFDASQVPPKDHLGLLGMQERAQMLPGILHIESVPNCGTTIVLEILNAN